MSRRKNIRYPLRTPVVYRWTDPTGLPCQAKGRTRDLSESGAYVCSSRCPSVGDPVELSVQLLGLRKTRGAENEDIDLSGTVVRVDRKRSIKTGLGFAVQRIETPLNEEVDVPRERDERVSSEDLVRMDRRVLLFPQ
jgi:hypothetical protein